MGLSVGDEVLGMKVLRLHRDGGRQAVTCECQKCGGSSMVRPWNLMLKRSHFCGSCRGAGGGENHIMHVALRDPRNIELARRVFGSRAEDLIHVSCGGKAPDQQVPEGQHRRGPRMSALREKFCEVLDIAREFGA